MSKIDQLRSLAITVSLIVVVGGIAAWLFFLTESGKNFLGDRVGEGSLPIIDFTRLELKGDQREYLLCPENYCAADAHAISETFYQSPYGLMQAFAAFADGQDGIKTHRLDLGERQIDFLLTGQGLDFPDVVTMQFIDLGEGKATLVVYSRSLVGTGTDREQHAERIARWIHAVKRSL